MLVSRPGWTGRDSHYHGLRRSSLDLEKTIPVMCLERQPDEQFGLSGRGRFYGRRGSGPWKLKGVCSRVRIKGQRSVEEFYATAWMSIE